MAALALFRAVATASQNKKTSEGHILRDQVSNDKRQGYRHKWMEHAQQMDDNMTPRAAVYYRPRGRRKVGVQGGQNRQYSLLQKRTTMIMMVVVVVTYGVSQRVSEVVSHSINFPLDYAIRKVQQIVEWGT
jgi:hypothetical protein